jgi:predicted phosphodiesterase
LRYLILSDIHANWPALEAVLDDAAGDYDRIISLGDFVGYGASPNEVVDWARAHVPYNIRGNHDRVACGLSSLDWFNDYAQAAAIWTMETLTTGNSAWLRALPRGPYPLEDFALIHGAPLDEDEYVTTATAARDAFDYLEPYLGFFGHTHAQGGFTLERPRIQTIARVPLSASSAVFEWQPGTRCLINPGSVGQPRDHDPRAAYAFYESGAQWVEYRRVAYDVAAAQKAILAAGLPPLLASRLSQGR